MNVGIIGAGGISRLHYQGYLEAGSHVVALADANDAILAERQRSWGVTRLYTDYHTLLEQPDIEAVSICLPNALHHPATLAAAKAGKHVLCEKPISLSLDKADEMVRVCRDAGVVLQIGHHLRFEGASTEAKRMIDSGRLGRITHLRFRQAHDWGGARAVRDSFGKLEQAGGGTLLDNGCHMFDLARFFGGDVTDVYARTATLGFDVEVEDTALVSLQFASGAIGTLEAAWTATGWENAFAVYGTTGALEYSNRFGEPTLRFSFRDSPGTTWDSPDLATFRYGGQGAHQRSVHSFLLAVQGLDDVVCTGEDGLEAVRLVLAAYESAKRVASVPVEEIQNVSLKQIVS